MKRIILFFAVCLGLSVSQTTFADDAEMVRAAAKRTTATTVTNSAKPSTNSNRTVASNTKKADSQKDKNTRTAAKPVQQRVTTSRTTAPQQTVKQRPGVQQPKTEKQTDSSRNISATSRSTTTRKVDTRKTESNVKKASRTAVTKNIKTKHVSRAAELNTEKIDNIKSKDYSKCKTVYFECMDEFCANKDTNLRRCACSSRIHEFDTIKKQLSAAEDKMLDFNQRLLTVNLDKEDATAINTATEGELAFEQKDRTESEKLLQKITSTLNNSGDSRLNNNLASISLSLDMDTAWDDIDSMGGVSTSAKEGLELYNAATPICVEMAKEVCSDEELDIAQGSYKLTIQQDCNTVAKSYDTLYNQAQEKIHESSALLDMSRLNIYQQRNSDDILTCKKKILTQLYDSSVCGEGLYKCLDTTGQYINPSTGKAVLTNNLYNLTSLLQEPTGDEKWSKISKNEKFVNFLNSKKEFLEPATKQCQEVSDLVWKDFLDDALSQIKLAQNAKLEEIRQSCTTLVAECKSASLTSLSEFDARALSTFSVLADATANSMCKDVENSCVALMDKVDSSELWKTGIAGISTDVTYDKIIETCTQIGRDCIIQQCNGTTGNFALCQKATDGKRADVLARRACWQDVYDCVKQADNLDNMTYGILSDREAYYKSTYGLENTDDYIAPLFCQNEDKACLIAEQIWGNCEYEPTQYDITSMNPEKLPRYEYDHLINSDNLKKSNKILIPSHGSSLLSWFASNTGTTGNRDSCSATGCPADYAKNDKGECEELLTSDCDNKPFGSGGVCPATNSQIINVGYNNITNFCADGTRDIYGNCCDRETSKRDSNGICIPIQIVNKSYQNSVLLQTIACDGTADNYLCPNNTKRKMSVYCVSTDSTGLRYSDKSTDNATKYYCVNGFWLLVDQYGNYLNLQDERNVKYVKMTYRPDDVDNHECTYKYNSGWNWVRTETGNNTPNCSDDAIPTDNEFMISYEQKPINN